LILPLEALDKLEWEGNKSLVESVLTSLVAGYATAERMEESGSWRHPIDLVTILENGFKELPVALEKGKRVRVSTQRQQKTEGTQPKQRWHADSHDRDALVAVLLGDDPQSIVNVLLEELRQGATERELASIVCYAAALRITQFHTRNEFSDWDAALHTFTFSNAVHQGLRRLPTMELLRGVFDAAMRIYLNRFLNIPPAAIPKKSIYHKVIDPVLRTLPELLDKQQRVNEIGQLVADYLYQGRRIDQLTSMLGKLLLQEDRNFHSIQMLEGAYRQYSLLDDDGNNAARVNILLAASRYLAAHSPTMRSQDRTYRIANQLHHGERLFEEKTI